MFIQSIEIEYFWWCLSIGWLPFDQKWALSMFHSHFFHKLNFLLNSSFDLFLHTHRSIRFRFDSPFSLLHNFRPINIALRLVKRSSQPQKLPLLLLMLRRCYCEGSRWFLKVLLCHWLISILTFCQLSRRTARILTLRRGLHIAGKSFTVLSSHYFSNDGTTFNKSLRWRVMHRWVSFSRRTLIMQRFFRTAYLERHSFKLKSFLHLWSIKLYTIYHILILITIDIDICKSHNCLLKTYP